MRAVSFAICTAVTTALGACTSEVETGRASYGDLCAGCHGDSGRGNGPAAAGLAVHPADLTGLKARNGGDFPRKEILEALDLYAKGEAHLGNMPALVPLLDGRTVLVQTGEGILTPTPEPVIALAAYLESIQN